jgi:hypothetical protein
MTWEEYRDKTMANGGEPMYMDFECLRIMELAATAITPDWDKKLHKKKGRVL